MNEPQAPKSQHIPHPGIAAVLSFLVPGLGQIYKREVLKGICYFLITSGLYASGIGFPLAVVIHFWVIIGASRPVKIS
jgi:TM2 domain-containing membrane protein YozV